MSELADDAWNAGMDDLRDTPFAEQCPRCKGTGCIDTPFSGGDPSCPDCNGEGVLP